MVPGLIQDPIEAMARSLHEHSTFEQLGAFSADGVY